MPAPAVIPAPRAYINAVAVKGFVVELWVVQERRSQTPTLWVLVNQPHLQPENNETFARDWNPQPRMQCMQRAPVILTVTKEA